MKCPFCNLEPARTLTQGKTASVILSNPRLLPGHSLVIPHRHTEHPKDVTRDELIEIFKLIDHTRSKLLLNGATGCDIRQNYRPFIKQGRLKVDHVHFHVIPRTNEDELYQKSMKFEKDIFTNLPNSERDVFMKLFS